jgi:hypothetical protein
MRARREYAMLAMVFGSGLGTSQFGRGPKGINRTAFDAALRREPYELIQAANEDGQPDSTDVGYVRLGKLLTQRRKEIDRKYDYRYRAPPDGQGMRLT